MPAIDLSTAQDILNHWLDAERAVSLNQSYQIGREIYTRADAKIITEKINHWKIMVESLTAGGSGGSLRFRSGVIVDV